MDNQALQTSGDAYTRLREFLDQDDNSCHLQGGLLEFCGDIEEAPDGIYEQAENLDGRIDDHESVMEEVEQALEIFSYREREAARPYVFALIEHKDRFGFVVQSSAQIAREFNEAYETEMVADDLEVIRRRLRDKGPIFGMCSRHSREFRHLLIGVLIERRNGSDMPGKLTSSHLKRFKHILEMEANGKLDMLDLYGLAKHLAELQVMPRQLTPSKVRAIMGCNATKADTLHRAYNLLPFSPIA